MSSSDDEKCAAKSLIIFTAILPQPPSSPPSHHHDAAAPPPAPLAFLPAPPRLPYACTRCHASFDKPQGLGGHMTRHRIKIAPAGAGAGAGDAPDQARGHACSDCDKRFPTGQALGGHKRKHFKGKIERGSSGKIGRKDAAAAAGPSGSPDGYSSGVSIEDGRRCPEQEHARRTSEPLDIDLNKPYKLDFRDFFK